MKTVILSKSCSRCGGSTIFKGQTFQKSVRRATPNGIGEKKCQRSLPAPPLDVFFRSRARFWSILGSRPGPKISLKPAPAKKSCGFSRPEINFLLFLRSGVFQEGPGALPEAPGTLPEQISVGFCNTFLQIPSGSFRRLSGSAGMLPGSASNLSNPLCGVPLGYGDLAQRFNSPYPVGVLAC